MKKVTLIFFLVFFVFINTGFSERVLWTTVSANLFSHNDKNYKEIYGDFLIAPEIKINADIFYGIYLWTSALFVPAFWESAEYNITAESKQYFLSLGFGDQLSFTEKIEGIFEIGVMYMFYTEEVAGESVTGSDLGFRINTGLNYRLTGNIFLCSMISYLKGASSLGEKEIKLGGLKASIGISITLINRKRE